MLAPKTDLDLEYIEMLFKLMIWKQRQIIQNVAPWKSQNKEQEYLIKKRFEEKWWWENIFLDIYRF